MRQVEKTFAERITDLEVEYESQADFAKSLGVSARTIRRWKHRTEPPPGWTTPGAKHQNIRQKVKRREQYYTREKRVAEVGTLAGRRVFAAQLPELFSGEFGPDPETVQTLINDAIARGTALRFTLETREPPPADRLVWKERIVVPTKGRASREIISDFYARMRNIVHDPDKYAGVILITT